MRDFVRHKKQEQRVHRQHRGGATVLADSWYAAALAARPAGAGLIVSLDDALRCRPALSWFAARSGVARGLLLTVLGRRHAAVLTTNPAPGARTAIALHGLLRRRRVVLLEYIQEMPQPGGPHEALVQLNFRMLRRGLLPHALLVGQVLTEVERLRYAAALGLGPTQLAIVSWPRSSTKTNHRPPAVSARGRSVLASGRRTDWDTFLAAAGGADWDVTVVCSASDSAAVSAATRDSSFTVYSEISADDHQALVECADVYVVAVPETGGSIGQIRVMNATDAGTALVVSDVTGVRGYVGANTAAIVSPGQPKQLRAKVDQLLADPRRRAELVDEATRAGNSWTMNDYLDALCDTIRSAITYPGTAP